MRVSKIVLVAGAACALLVGAGCLRPAAAPSPRFVHFESGLDRPRVDDDYIEIGLVIATLREKPDLHVAVIGYASAEGEATANKSLSLRRAECARRPIVITKNAAS
jgi:outer membrane protein OmpA-like peptidoglycan-associated protein